MLMLLKSVTRFSSFGPLTNIKEHFSTSQSCLRKTHALNYHKWAKYTVRRHNLIKHGRNKNWVKYKQVIDSLEQEGSTSGVNLEKFGHVRQSRNLDHFNLFPERHDTSICAKPLFFESKDGSAVLGIHNYYKLQSKTKSKPIQFKDMNDYSTVMNPSDVELAKSLVEGDDCFLWTTRSLSHLFKVKEEVVKKLVPPTRHQLDGWKVEKMALMKLSAIERKRYNVLKDKERNSAALLMLEEKLIHHIPKFCDEIFV